MNATHTHTSAGAADIRRDAISAIEKLADERRALWDDYLATVAERDQLEAERNKLKEALTALLTWAQARCLQPTDDPWGKSAFDRASDALRITESEAR